MNSDFILLRLLILLFVYPFSHLNAAESSFSGSSSTTLIAPVIDLTVVPYQSRIAQLSWTTTDPGLDGTYFVERQTALSTTWDLLTQMPFNTTLEYDDTISYPYCSDTNFSYRIRFLSTVPGNDTISDTVIVLLKDATQPANVQNVVVSITPTMLPIITWTPVPSDDIFGYEIERYNSGSWFVRSTVPATSNSYVDTVSNACDISYAYVVITIDRCGLRRPPSYTPRMQTIKLDFPPIDECERLAKLSWNPYNLMPGGLGGYQIFRMIDYGTPSQIANITDTLNTAFIDAYQFVNGHNYTYYVQAYNTDSTITSLSCKQTWKYTGATLPDSVYITSVSVIDDSYINISYHSSPDSTVKKMILERSIDGGASFQAIDSMSVVGDFVPQTGAFKDTTADVHSQSYYYRLVALDYCGTKILYSNISRSVFLQCSSSQTQNTIDWNAYESWLEDVEGYRVYRTVAGQPPAGDSIGNVTPVTLTFPDLLSGIDPTKQVCYWVKAEENPGNPYLVNATSVSNTCCIIKGATLFMPNAFHPGGKNNRFRPVATFVDPQKFKMTIFNRWGQQVFETSDMVSGWNGLINDQIAPLGLYAYIITYSSLGGQDYTKRGTVLVVR
jgi:hypothetical protein